MMKQLIGRQVWVAALLVLVAGAWNAPAEAQTQMGERITILVPTLAPGEGLRDRFGNQVANELRSQIDDMQFHQTVAQRELRDALRRYGLSNEDLYQCIRARQLAMQQGWGLVVCGDYQNAGGGEVRVTASFVSAHTGEGYDVEPFTVSERDPRQAAQRMLEAFDVWQTQLRHTLFCMQYIDSEQWDEALTNCQQALAINPGSRDARYMLASIYWHRGEYQEALDAVEKVLEADPIRQDALKLGGIAATRLGQREQARQYLDRYMELNPGDVHVRLTIATEIAQDAADPEAALRFAEGGLEIEPDNLDLLTYIGHFATNAAVQAEAAVARGEAVDPMHIGELYQTAARAYERVFDEQGDETDAQILERLVVAKFKLGETEEAVALGRRATEAMPDNGRIWVAYSRALEEAGNVAEALAAIQRAEGLDMSGAALTQRKAMLMLGQNNVTDAVATLSAAVQRGDVQPRAAFAIVFRHAHQARGAGRLADAHRVLEQAGPLATAEEDRLARNFWMGYALFEQARTPMPETAAAAQRAKPMFERALELFQSARGYERIEPSANVPAYIENSRRFLEIADALIRRGR
jgi:tetratricopeptide (TPR) repeat protein